MTSKESKHTPGPWRVSQGTWIVDGRDVTISKISTEIPSRNRESNARLIAAAPDLLSALEGMLEWARRVKVLNPGMEVANAVNAIAKAKG